MIVVRNVFQAKYGQGDAVVAAFKTGLAQAGADEGVRRWRLLTDLSGPFFTIVLELEVESLAAWAEVRAHQGENEAISEAFGKTADLIAGGRLELYTVEAEG